MTHYQIIHPAFLVEDLEQAVRFYVDVLGFEKKWAWPGREGEPDIRIGV